MKNILTRVLVLFALVLLAAPAAAETRVYLFAGQSNMCGLGITAELPAPYNKPQTDVNYWSGGQWVALRGGFGYNSSQFGPEVSFGRTIKDAHPDDEIYLVKYAVSGTSLAVGWDVDGTDTAGTYYRNFKSTAEAALANLQAAGKMPVLAGMLWMQGESDAQVVNWSKKYQANLIDLINTVRDDFDAPNMEFVIGRITTYPLWETPDYPGSNARVRLAQETVPTLMDNVHWINTDDLTFNETWPVGGHYGTEGQIELGIRFASALPEPSTLVLAVFAFSGLLAWVWRWR